MGTVGYTAPSLVERRAEVQRIERVVDAVADGDGSFVLVEGPAGIGKSRLLAAVRESAERAGFAVLNARGGELERDFAFGVVRQLFEQRLVDAPDSERAELLSGAAELAAPAVGLGHGAQAQTPGDVSFPVVHGLYWLATNLAAERPLLIEVDDLHWTDSPTLRFLLHLVPRLEGAPILIAAATRPGEPASDAAMLAKLSADPATTLIGPGPLSPDGIAALVSEVMGRESDEEFARACHSASGGNPFFALAILRALGADRIEPDARAAARVLEVGPDAVERALMMRLAQLPAACTPLAHAVATLGARAEFAHAAELAGQDHEQAGEAADALAAVEILAPQRPLTFIHPVVREAIYRDIPPSERAALHARAASVLSTAGVDPAELAPHLLATDPAGRPAVVEALRVAADEALGQGAADLARRYLTRALAEPAEGDERLACLALLGTAEWLTGEPGSAAEHLREATEGTTDPLLRAERAVALARAIFYTGQVPMAVEALERAAADTEGASGESIDRLEAEICSIGLLSPLTVDRALARIAASGVPEGNSVGELLKLTNHASREWMMGTADRAAEFGAGALAGDRLAESEGPDSVAVMQAAWVLGFADRQERAIEAITPMVELATKRGSIFGYTTWRGILGMVQISRGDMISAEADSRAALELSDVPAFSRVALYTFLALALTERGALDEAEVAVTESGCGPFLPPMVQMNMAFYARGRLRLAQGRPEEALADFQELGERNHLCRVAAPAFAFAWRCGAVEANRMLGNIEAARRLAEDQLVEARRWDTPAAIGVAMHAAATVAEEEQALPMFGEAVELLASSPDRLGHARAQVDLGAALRRAGRRTQAREPLRQGLEMARRCGATVLVERAHEELVTAGARPRRLMFSGLESLTAAERRVARRAADGRANREIAQELFVTTKTVENHLSRVYSKLDIGGRDELAVALEGAEPQD